jgi:hypothetical protein
LKKLYSSTVIQLATAAKGFPSNSVARLQVAVFKRVLLVLAGAVAGLARLMRGDMQECRKSTE